MKNEDNSFSVLAAIILAGVVLACVPTAHSDITLAPETATTTSVTAAITAPKSDTVALKASPNKSGTCVNERRGERGFKAEAKLGRRTKFPAV